MDRSYFDAITVSREFRAANGCILCARVRVVNVLGVP